MPLFYASVSARGNFTGSRRYTANGIDLRDNLIVSITSPPFSFHKFTISFQDTAKRTRPSY
jgi:hypothetical protein